MGEKLKQKLDGVKWKHYINYIIILLACVLFLIFDKAGLMKRQFRTNLNTVAINIILAVSLNLLVGYIGELALGHAGFMSIGAFIGGYISLQLNSIGVASIIRLPLAMLAGGISASLISVLIGFPVMKLRGDYVAIVTLAFGEIIKVVIKNLNNINIFGTSIGLQGVPQDLASTSTHAGYIISFITVMITLILIQNLIYSKNGRAMKAIRDNEISARACGVRVVYYKMMAFIVSAFFAGIAGVLYSHSQSIVTSSSFDYNRSIEILLIVVLGGLGNLTGSIISATFITFLPNWLENIGLGKFRLLVYAIILIAAMILNSSEGGKRLLKKIKDFFRNIWGKIVSFLKSKKQSATKVKQTENTTTIQSSHSEEILTEKNSSNDDLNNNLKSKTNLKEDK